MSTHKVLLIDDDADIRKIGKLSLSGVGKWEVCVAATGGEAVQVMAAEQPDIVLLDASMPDMDAIDTLQRLIDLPGSNSMKVIITSAKPDEVNMPDFMQVGAIGLLAKPFNPMTLPSQIEALLEEQGK